MRRNATRSYNPGAVPEMIRTVSHAAEQFIRCSDRLYDKEDSNNCRAPFSCFLRPAVELLLVLHERQTKRERTPYHTYNLFLLFFYSLLDVILTAGCLQQLLVRIECSAGSQNSVLPYTNNINEFPDFLPDENETILQSNLLADIRGTLTMVHDLIYKFLDATGKRTHFLRHRVLCAISDLFINNGESSKAEWDSVQRSNNWNLSNDANASGAILRGKYLAFLDSLEDEAGSKDLFLKDFDDLRTFSTIVMDRFIKEELCPPGPVLHTFLYLHLNKPTNVMKAIKKLLLPHPKNPLLLEYLLRSHLVFLIEKYDNDGFVGIELVKEAASISLMLVQRSVLTDRAIRLTFSSVLWEFLDLSQRFSILAAGIDHDSTSALAWELLAVELYSHLSYESLDEVLAAFHNVWDKPRLNNWKSNFFDLQAIPSTRISCTSLPFFWSCAAFFHELGPYFFSFTEELIKWHVRTRWPTGITNPFSSLSTILCPNQDNYIWLFLSTQPNIIRSNLYFSNYIDVEFVCQKETGRSRFIDCETKCECFDGQEPFLIKKMRVLTHERVMTNSEDSVSEDHSECLLDEVGVARVLELITGFNIFLSCSKYYLGVYPVNQLRVNENFFIPWIFSHSFGVSHINTDLH